MQHFIPISSPFPPLPTLSVFSFPPALLVAVCDLLSPAPLPVFKTSSAKLHIPNPSILFEKSGFFFTDIIAEKRVLTLSHRDENLLSQYVGENSFFKNDLHAINRWYKLSMSKFDHWLLMAVTDNPERMVTGYTMSYSTKTFTSFTGEMVEHYAVASRKPICCSFFGFFWSTRLQNFELW